MTTPSLLRNLAIYRPTGTQRLAPSNATKYGELSRVIAYVAIVTPSLARIFVMVAAVELFTTHRFAPSKASPNGTGPAPNVPRFPPSLARSLEIVPSP